MLTAAIVQKILALFLSMFLSFGWITPPSAENPITFADSENVKLSFVTVADTHVLADSFSAYNFESVFRDMENSEEAFDAVVIPGDLTELGLGCEYDAFFDVLDRETVAPAKILATGNHDVRYAYEKNKKLIMGKAEQYLDIDTKGESFYSYDLKGYTFIVLGTEKQILERAYISDRQLAFLDSELARATANGKPAFVICHQALANTHGLPEVWITGDLGDQSQQVRGILTKYKNVFYLNGHLHDGVYERSFEKLSEGVYSLNIAGYKKTNDFGIKDKGVGYFVEVYGDRVIFTARNFKEGKTYDVAYNVELV